MSFVPEKHVLVYCRLTTEMSRRVLFQVGKVALIVRGVFQLDGHQEMTALFFSQLFRGSKQSLPILFTP
jgi:hypothetical protein